MKKHTRFFFSLFLLSGSSPHSNHPPPPSTISSATSYFFFLSRGDGGAAAAASCYVRPKRRREEQEKHTRASKKRGERGREGRSRAVERRGEEKNVRTPEATGSLIDQSVVPRRDGITLPTGYVPVIVLRQSRTAAHFEYFSTKQKKKKETTFISKSYLIRFWCIPNESTTRLCVCVCEFVACVCHIWILFLLSF